jgi:L-seryl-tRNA(Ser) seleniumtransferase
LSDYEKAIGESTSLVMRVHPSNYKIVGFTESPSLEELAEMSHRKGVMLYEDAGSGVLLDLAKYGLTDEPVISRSISDGADLVSFSGDKLLGGAQAGLIVGKRNLVEQIRKHPLYRALRVDKLIYAALQATLEAYVRDYATESVPVLRMLSATRDEIKDRSSNLIARLRELCPESVKFESVAGESVVGGGSSPTVRLETMLIAIKSSTLSCEGIDERLRAGETPVIGRIEEDTFLLDLRTVSDTQETRLIEMFAAVLG